MSGGVGSFLDLMPDVVKIAPFSSRDAYGVSTYGADVGYNARVVGQRRLVRDAAGREVTSSYTVYLGTNAVIGVEDRVTLSTAVAQSTAEHHLHPPILGVGRYPDQVGVHHVVVFLP